MEKTYPTYDKLLWLYIASIIISMALFFGFIVLMFFILKKCKLISSQKILKRWTLAIGIFLAIISLMMSFPAFLDICMDSYCVQNEVESITRLSKTTSSRRMNKSHTLICQIQNGERYECYDYLYSIEKIEQYSENNCIIYGKHSKILLDWIKVD